MSFFTLCIASFVTAAGLTTTAAAGPLVTYGITFNVTRASYFEPGTDCNYLAPPPPYLSSREARFGCINPGDVYQGTFDIDSDILAVDGVRNGVAARNIKINFGRLILGQGGYNLDDGFHYPIFQFFPSTMTVQDGLLTDISAVWSLPGDQASIDPFNGRFSGGHPGIQNFGGTFVLNAIPEPHTIALALAALGAIALARRTRAERA